MGEEKEKCMACDAVTFGLDARSAVIGILEFVRVYGVKRVIEQRLCGACKEILGAVEAEGWREE